MNELLKKNKKISQKMLQRLLITNCLFNLSSKKDLRKFIQQFTQISIGLYNIQKFRNQVSHLHMLVFNLTGKIDLRKDDIRVTLPDLSIYYTWKKFKKWYGNNKTWMQYEKRNFNYVIDLSIHHQQARNTY